MTEEKNDKIIIPTLKVNEVIKPLLEDISRLSAEADKISIVNPISAYRKLLKYSRRMKDMTPDYYKYNDYCLNRLSEPVNHAPGSIGGLLQVWSMASGLTAVMRLQSAWKDFGATMDRKIAFSVAVFSLYVSIISLLATVIFGNLLTALMPENRQPNTGFPPSRE